ncbi:hypothetical protein [Bacillus thuringiensis]|uniref:hypothetical protein n=1 Tax=Bacillus thuringiensis TaxID=1428 RepID=UPI000BFD5096|nr:hypothetical protein [Bacillus thuringiensis]PGM50830.1 hypothetical protein CN949_16195 [Bacillus thuringiensis]
MTTLTKKMNRAELLQMAIDGKVTKGDKFKDERGWDVTFDGMIFKWESGSSLTASVHPNEHFIPVFVDKDVTITLKQSEINSLRTLVGDESVSGLQRKKDQYSHPFEIITSNTKYREMFDKLEKEVR